MVLTLVRWNRPKENLLSVVFPLHPCDRNRHGGITPGGEGVAVKGAQPMNEASIYIVERNAWSIERQQDVHFRLTYERVFLPVQNLWRDFLVHCEETDSTLAN